jgi:SAM-dependent methyltransferase
VSSAARHASRRYLTLDELRADFDRIAKVAPEGSPPQFARYAWIERQLPLPPARALDLGCGTGALTRILAERCGEAVGVDLSPAMLSEAHARTPHGCRARYLEGDFRSVLAGGETFDVVTAVATLHHLPISEAFREAAARVRPGGLLLVVDLHESPRLPDGVRRIGRWCLDRIDDVLLARGPRHPGVGAAWLEHGDKERLPSKDEIRRAQASRLPGAKLEFHLRWRWSLAWRAPASG